MFTAKFLQCPNHFACKIIRTMSSMTIHVPEQRDVGSLGCLPCDSSHHLALKHMKRASVLAAPSVNIRHCIINNVWIMCLFLLLVLRCNGHVLGNTDVHTLSCSGCFPTRWFSMTRSGTSRFETPTASVWRHPEVKKLTMTSLSRFQPQLHPMTWRSVYQCERCLSLFSPEGETGLLVSKITDIAPFVGYAQSEEQNERKRLRNVLKKGDLYFNSGDLMRIDNDNFLYFQDRVGDTFRYRHLRQQWLISGCCIWLLWCFEGFLQADCHSF